MSNSFLILFKIIYNWFVFFRYCCLSKTSLMILITMALSDGVYSQLLTYVIINYIDTNTNWSSPQIWRVKVWLVTTGAFHSSYDFRMSSDVQTAAHFLSVRYPLRHAKHWHLIQSLPRWLPQFGNSASNCRKTVFPRLVWKWRWFISFDRMSGHRHRYLV